MDEKIICQDATLSKLDQTQANLYKQILPMLSGQKLEAIKKAQKNWLINRKACTVPETRDAGDPEVPMKIEDEIKCIRTLIEWRVEELKVQISRGKTAAGQKTSDRSYDEFKQTFHINLPNDFSLAKGSKPVTYMGMCNSADHYIDLVEEVLARAPPRPNNFTHFKEMCSWDTGRRPKDTNAAIIISENGRDNCVANWNTLMDSEDDKSPQGIKYYPIGDVGFLGGRVAYNMASGHSLGGWYYFTYHNHRCYMVGFEMEAYSHEWDESDRKAFVEYYHGMQTKLQGVLSTFKFVEPSVSE